MPFPHGSLALLARQAGISKQFVTNVLKLRRKCSLEIAEKLVRAAQYQGLNTSVFDWMNADMTENPLFKEV